MCRPLCMRVCAMSLSLSLGSRVSLQDQQALVAEAVDGCGKGIGYWVRLVSDERRRGNRIWRVSICTRLRSSQHVRASGHEEMHAQDVTVALLFDVKCAVMGLYG